MEVNKANIVLERKICRLVRRDRKVMLGRPSGHKVVVEVFYQYVPSSSAEIEILLAEKKPAQLVPSGEQFTNEHFEALLELPLSGADAEFVRFFERRNNRPCTPKEWTEAGFAEKGFVRINAMCKKYGLHLRFRIAERGESWPTQKNNFCVMKERDGKGSRGA